MKKKWIFGLSIFFILVTMLFYLNNNPKNTIIQYKNNYKDDNSEEVEKMYVETNEGSIKNHYTEESPLIMTIGENYIFHMAFKSENYQEMKQIAASAVYDNNIQINNGSAQILTRTMNDEFYDQFNGIRFGFRAINTGECRVVIHDKRQSNDAYETIYVRVVPANSIVVKDSHTNKYVSTDNVTVDTEEEVVFQAVLTGGLNMDGDKPSEAYYRGSGFWSWDVPVTNEWTKIENNKWLTTYRITTQGSGNFTIGLGKNGNGQIDSIGVHVVHNKIEVDTINMGSMTYQNINKNVATRMMNGTSRGDNNFNNRYPVNVSEVLKINAKVRENYSFDYSDNGNFELLDSSYNDGVLSLSVKGLMPGDNDIVLKDENDNIVETFYVQVRYPIYVNTSVGEIYKDFVHEYLGVALGDFYNSHNDAVVTSPDYVPQYVKNGFDHYMFYYLFGDNSVELTSYVKADDDKDFEFEGNLEMTNHKVENITTGEKAGFKRISAEFSITESESGGAVRVGNDTFIMADKNPNEKVQHFDLETQDGGRGTIIETTNYHDGKTVVVETHYTASITDIHGSSIINKNKESLLEIAKNEYWQTSPSTSTQYESTSAYITNENGNLIDDMGNVIDQGVINGLLQPRLKTRDIILSDIDSVVFKVDLSLNPTSKVIKTYKTNSEGKKELVDTKTEDIQNGESINYENYELPMTHKQIVDAYNKCPFHSGLDFTIKLVVTQNEYYETNPFTKNSIMIIVSILIITITGIVYVNRKKKENII